MDSIKTVVVTSSVAAVARRKFEPNHVLCEDDWSDCDLMRQQRTFYPLSKTLAEQEVWKWEEGVRDKIRVATVNPPFIFGPCLQPTLNTSTEIIIKLVNGKLQGIPNTPYSMVDVRDVAKMHLLALENEEVKGRLLGIAYARHSKELCEDLRRLFPERNNLIPSKLDFEGEPIKPMAFNNSKLVNFGFEFIDIDTMLKDTVISAEEQGFLPKV